jgi:hypothetical protein
LVRIVQDAVHFYVAIAAGLIHPGQSARREATGIVTLNDQVGHSIDRDRRKVGHPWRRKFNRGHAHQQGSVSGERPCNRQRNDGRAGENDKREK